MEDEHVYKRHNKTLLLYHIVLPIKYRRNVITEAIGLSLKSICLDISERYEINFVEIGYESDHVHFLLQSVPAYSVTSIVTKLKSLTARELFSKHPEVKKQLWGGSFWTSGYYANTVGLYGSRDVIKAYVSNQGNETKYKKLVKYLAKSVIFFIAFTINGSYCWYNAPQFLLQFDGYVREQISSQM